jgi:hypothetical protein
MEVAIDEMLDIMQRVDNAATQLELPFRPKAVYVSNTNVVSGSTKTDNIHMPFEDRQARPILIWRHLVQNRGIDPASIAVYLNLKFDAKHQTWSSLFRGSCRRLAENGSSTHAPTCQVEHTYVLFSSGLRCK